MHEVTVIRDLYYLMESNIPLHKGKAPLVLTRSNVRDSDARACISSYMDILEDVEDEINYSILRGSNSPRSVLTLNFNPRTNTVEKWIYDTVSNRNYLVEFDEKKIIFKYSHKE